MSTASNYKINTQKLKGYRKLKRLTQEELAKKVETSRTYYADIERGKAFGSVRMLAKIADCLGCKLDELIVKESTGDEKR